MSRFKCWQTCRSHSGSSECQWTGVLLGESTSSGGEPGSSGGEPFGIKRSSDASPSSHLLIVSWLDSAFSPNYAFEPLHWPLLAPIMLTFPSPSSNITPQTLKASARSCWGRVPASPLRVNSTRPPLYSCCSICSAHGKFPAGSFAFQGALISIWGPAGSPVAPRLWNEKGFCSLGRQRFLLRSSICQVLNVPLQQQSIQSLWSCINLSQSWETF